MINREDIKEGLKFRMPNNKIERKHQGATDMCESTQYLTTLKTPHGDKNYVTPEVPLFEVRSEADKLRRQERPALRMGRRVHQGSQRCARKETALHIPGRRDATRKTCHRR